MWWHSSILRFVFLLLFSGLVLFHGAHAQEMDIHEYLVPLEEAALELAKNGRDLETKETILVMENLGFPQKEAARLRESCADLLSKTETAAESVPKVAHVLRNTAGSLALLLDDLPELKKEHLARQILILDGTVKKAHLALGHEYKNKQWISPLEERLKERRGRILEALGQARELDVPIEIIESDLPVLETVCGQRGIKIRSHHMEIHTTLCKEKGTRILRETMRALAFSSFLLNDSLEVPIHLKSRWVVLDDPDTYKLLVDDAVQAGGLAGSEAEAASQLMIFFDRRGYGVIRDFHEAGLAAGLFCYLDPLVHGTQPCLKSGHLNWVCLSFLKTPMPKFVRFELINGRKQIELPYGARETYEAFSTKEYWEDVPLADAGLAGLRAWIANLAERRKDPAWYRSMLAEEGKVQQVNLQKTTMVVEYLYEQGPLLPLMNKTRPKMPSNKGKSTPRLFEQALGEPLDTFERRWKSWIIPCHMGLAEALMQPAERLLSKDQTVFMTLLNEIRKRGVGRVYMKQMTEALFQEEQLEELDNRFYRDLYEVKIDQALCQGAMQHVQYLKQNTDQAEGMELTDKHGFTTEGAWAGLHSLIARGVYKPEDALTRWMAGFYHRLPLLHPGLLRVGFAYKHRTAVLDAQSFVVNPVRGEWTIIWPYDGMTEVPCKYIPESPHPVPDEASSKLGYPVTVQVWKFSCSPKVWLSLYEGKGKERKVPCFFISPFQPLNQTKVPAHAFGLIPKSPLKPKTHYTVFADMEHPDKDLTWTFKTGR